MRGWRGGVNACKAASELRALHQAKPDDDALAAGALDANATRGAGGVEKLEKVVAAERVAKAARRRPLAVGLVHLRRAVLAQTGIKLHPLLVGQELLQGVGRQAPALQRLQVRHAAGISAATIFSKRFGSTRSAGTVLEKRSTRQRR